MLINYQGELRSPTTGEAVPAGLYDMTFVLYADELDPRPLWRGDYTVANRNPVEVRNGIFNVILGSGEGNALDASAFGKPTVWLEIIIERETLKPRQRITSTAYAMVSEDSRYLDGKSATDFLTRSQADARYWSLVGSAGTVPATNFLGTIDNQALELHVNGARAMRLEPNASTPNIITGFAGNAVTPGAVGATISGGGLSGNANLVSDSYGTIGGGGGNLAGDNTGTTDDRTYATVGGGRSNYAKGQYATVSGGWSNEAANVYATVGGGYDNAARANSATVGGGYANNASSDSATIAGGRNNTATGSYATVAGGYSNAASADYATIAGGGRWDPSDAATANRVTDIYGTVGGGADNQAGDDAGTTDDAPYATVGGGQSNTASADVATVGGGWNNIANGTGATVAGGWRITASGDYATVPGGYSNVASGDYSLAAGSRAHAAHSGTFVWADSNPWHLASSASDEFSARATGGVRFISGINSDTGATTAGVRLPAGAGAWSTISDRALKGNAAPADGKEVLRQLMSIPISTWNYIAQDPSVRHIGPMAQDFYAAFGLGEDEKHISTVDADGVALAAIQGLHELLREKDEKIATLEARIAALESLVAKLVESQTGGEE
jgi:hypothetical protein